MKRARLTWRDMRDELRRLGAVEVRTKGSHATWRFQDGDSFTVIINHLSDDVPAGIASLFKRFLKKRSGALKEAS